MDSLFDFTPDAIAALVQVFMIDLALAGDNAVVMGTRRGRTPARRERRGRVILVGIAAATVLRLAFAAVALELLEIVGLLLAGGILLLWVCWKMYWRELRGQEAHRADAADTAQAPRKSFAQVTWQIVVADVSMSLDNVLAVAGAARDHPAALVSRIGTLDRTDGRRRWIHCQAAQPPPAGLAMWAWQLFSTLALDSDFWRGAHEVWPHIFG